MKHFNRLRQLRLEKKIEAEKIAEKLNISTQYYYDLETGRRRLNADILLQLADFFDVSIDYILGRTEYRFVPKSLFITEKPYLYKTKNLSQDEKDLKELLEIVEREYWRRKKRGDEEVASLDEKRAIGEKAF